MNMQETAVRMLQCFIMSVSDISLMPSILFVHIGNFVNS